MDHRWPHTGQWSTTVPGIMLEMVTTGRLQTMQTTPVLGMSDSDTGGEYAQGH